MSHGGSHYHWQSDGDWTPGHHEEVLLQQPLKPGLQQQMMSIMPCSSNSMGYWSSVEAAENQVALITKQFNACLMLLIRLGFGDAEARLSLLRHRLNLQAAMQELYHTAFIGKLRRASQTRAELGYSRSDVYKCGHKCLQKFQPCLASIVELRDQEAAHDWEK